jgi:hypothetical protein
MASWIKYRIKLQDGNGIYCILSSVEIFVKISNSITATSVFDIQNSIIICKMSSGNTLVEMACLQDVKR